MRDTIIVRVIDSETRATLLVAGGMTYWTYEPPPMSITAQRPIWARLLSAAGIGGAP